MYMCMCVTQHSTIHYCPVMLLITSGLILSTACVMTFFGSELFLFFVALYSLVPSLHSQFFFACCKKSGREPGQIRHVKCVISAGRVRGFFGML